MNKVYLQIWEESISNEGTRPDGCSLHIDLESNQKYLKSIYEFRENLKIPNDYDSAVGEPVEVLVNDAVLETYFLGYDDQVQKDKMLYLNMLYNMTEFGIAHQFNKIIF